MHTLNDLITATRMSYCPAPALKAVCLAQWLLESGRGQSLLAKQYANFAGLKFRREMEGHAKSVRYVAHDGPDEYCHFQDARAFVAGYWHFIDRDVYSGWEKFSNDPSAYIKFLHSRGYAGDPEYGAKVLTLVPEATRLLSDTGGAVYEEPPRAARSEVKASHLDLLAGRQPQFETLGHVRHNFRGLRPNGLEGAIVHYDAGRCRARSTAGDLEAGAKRTLESGEENGFAYATISRSGRIYLPSNMDWLCWGYHAGESFCTITERASVSRYYVGFELNCPGYVYPTEDADTFIAWFDAERDADNKVIVDKKGRATLKSKNPEIYDLSSVRYIKHATGNIRRGYYVPFTLAQQESLKDVLLWLKMRFPKTFRLDYVFGHDEVSPGRKVDPGGSYGILENDGVGPPLTMIELRQNLLKSWSDMQIMS